MLAENRLRMHRVLHQRRQVTKVQHGDHARGCQYLGIPSRDRHPDVVGEEHDTLHGDHNDPE